MDGGEFKWKYDSSCGHFSRLANSIHLILAVVVADDGTTVLLGKRANPCRLPNVPSEKFFFSSRPKDSSWRTRSWGSRRNGGKLPGIVFFFAEFIWIWRFAGTMFPVQCVDIIPPPSTITSLLAFDSFIHSSNFFISTTTDGSRKKVIWNKGGDGIKMYGKLVEQPMFALLVEAY